MRLHSNHRSNNSCALIYSIRPLGNQIALIAGAILSEKLSSTLCASTNLNRRFALGERIRRSVRGFRSSGRQLVRPGPVACRSAPCAASSRRRLRPESMRRITKISPRSRSATNGRPLGTWRAASSFSPQDAQSPMTAPTSNCLDFLRLSEREHCATINAAVSASELRTAKFRPSAQNSDDRHCDTIPYECEERSGTSSL
jgi:hypothetical protein